MFEIRKLRLREAKSLAQVCKLLSGGLGCELRRPDSKVNDLPTGPACRASPAPVLPPWYHPPLQAGSIGKPLCWVATVAHCNKALKVRAVRSSCGVTGNCIERVLAAMPDLCAIAILRLYALSPLTVTFHHLHTLPCASSGTSPAPSSPAPAQFSQRKPGQGGLEPALAGWSRAQSALSQTKFNFKA